MSSEITEAMIEAALAYDVAAVNLHGEFARNADGVLSEKDLAA